MKKLITAAFLLTLVIFSNRILAQDFGGKWSCDYVTDDNEAMGTGNRTISVGVINENTFVALVYRSEARGQGYNAFYLVGYSNADSVQGRLGDYGPLYGTNYAGKWESGFDFVTLNEVYDLATTPDSLIYVANNNGTYGRNILVFKMTSDSIISTDYRMATNADSVWAIDVDANGYVYVTTFKDSVTPGNVLVYKGIKDDPGWSGNHNSSPVATINIPDGGDPRGVAVNSQGTLVYVSNSLTKKVYCYTGSPSDGYTLYNGFNFTVNDSSIHSGSTAYATVPWGMKYMNDKNILFVTCDANTFQPGIGYDYGRTYEVNPNTGEVLDTLDEAAWNLAITGVYDSHSSERASGYASVHKVDFDENDNVYTQSYFSWTINKWTYSKTLPTIPVSITGIQKAGSDIPDNYSLEQNYPNPFNPTTTISYYIPKEAFVTLRIYDVLGKEVAEIVNRDQRAGRYQVEFNAANLSSGIYYYKIKAGSFTETKKMILLK